MPKKFVLLSIAPLFILAPIVAGAIEIKPPLKMTSLYDILNAVKNISLVVVLPLAIVALLVAAFFILKSQGIPEEVAKGRKILTAGLIGVAVVIIGAGSSALIMNIFGLRETPGITVSETYDASLDAMDKYLDSVCPTNTDLSLKALCDERNNLEKCEISIK